MAMNPESLGRFPKRNPSSDARKTKEKPQTNPVFEPERQPIGFLENASVT